MPTAMSQPNLSSRAYDRARSMKLARTIADRVGWEKIQSAHLAEALQYWPKLLLGQNLRSHQNLINQQVFLRTPTT